MILNSQNSVFLQFLAAAQISRVNWAKWMEIEQDNLRIGTARLSRVL